MKTLEVKQQADDKANESKRQYGEYANLMNTVWQVRTGFLINTVRGTAAAGTTSAGNTRIGNTINLRSARIKFHALFPRNSDGIPLGGGLAVISTRCRVIIVDNLKNIRGLGAADILQNTAYPLTSPYKSQVDAGKRYRVLADYKFNLNSHSTSDKQFEFKMPLPKSGRVVHYDGTNADPSDLNVSLVWFCKDISPLSASQPSLNYYVNSVFEDA